MATVNNNKESFELLRGTPDSNSGSEVSEIVFPARKKRFRRRLRNNPSTKHEDLTTDCRCKATTVSLTLFCIVLICWLITLTWLAVVLHSELIRLNIDVAKVVAGSQGVPDALQKCHSLSRDLQKNQSQIMERLKGFSLLLNNFSLEMTEVKNGLHTVQEQLKSAPDLVNNPTLMKDLFTNIASLGSQIKDLDAEVSLLKDKDYKKDGVVNNLVSNVTEMRAEMNEISNANKERGSFTRKDFDSEKQSLLGVINQVSTNVTTVNDTLNTKLQWTVDDRTKDHKTIESLQEASENITARVRTLEQICAKRTEPKTDVQADRTEPKTMAPTSSPPPPLPEKSLPGREGAVVDGGGSPGGGGREASKAPQNPT